VATAINVYIGGRIYFLMNRIHFVRSVPRSASTRTFAKAFGLLSQPIGPKQQDDRRPLCDQGGGKRETAMTEVDSTFDPFVDAEIKEHHAALIRQMVANCKRHLCYVDIGWAASLIHKHGDFVF
jgi:hypothetical protein